MCASRHQPSVVSSAMVVVWLVHFLRAKASFWSDGVCCGDLAAVSALLTESAAPCKFFYFFAKSLELGLGGGNGAI